MGELDGKVAIVTGGAYGMGESTVRLFAREGAKIVIADILDREGAEVAASINSQGGDALFVHLDVSQESEWSEAVLRSLFAALYEQNVLLEGTILKASMVIAGKDCPEQADVQEVAESTLMCLKSTVPAILPGIVFLSGGQEDEDATAHLDAMNRLGPNPWTLSFSYGRAMQQAALKLWAKDMDANFRKAQDTVFARARDNSRAALGQWQGEG